MAYALMDEDQFQDPNKAMWQTAQASLGAGGGTTPQAMAQPAPAAGTSRFVSFDRYLNANRDAAARTGEQLGYGVQKQGEAAKTAQDVATKNFGIAAGKGMGGTQKTAGQSGIGLPSPYVGGLPSPNPTTYAQPISRDEAAALGATTYTGPRTLAEFAPQLQGQTEAAQRTAAQLGNEQGRRALLSEGMGRLPGAYSGSMANLDEALASGVGSNRERFGKTAERFGHLGDWLKLREAEAQRIGELSAGETEAQAKKFRDQVAGYDAAIAAGRPPTTAERDADTERRNEATQGRNLAAGVPVSEQVTSTTDENAARGYGDKIYDQWVAAGRPEFSGWIRSKKKR